MNSAIPPFDPPTPVVATQTESDAGVSPSDSPPSPVQSPPRGAGAIPDHELVCPIASGAYGEVWLARNVVGTLRAVKIVRRDRHASTESFEREFKGLQKFEPVSRSHDGLVDILTLGMLPDGAGFYYVMELADAASDQCSVISNQSSVPSTLTVPLKTDHGSLITGYSPRTLRADLKTRGALPADDVLTLGLKLTAALAHLHAQGLVHRDVKPSNILFIGGEPKLADAGLVAAVDDARSLVGTAGYIAPEGPGTPQADLYALGKVLYEAAFGKDRQEFPALPADVASRPDHARVLELNAVLLKACAADSRERYRSAEHMCRDLELLRTGRSVKRRQSWQRTVDLIWKLALATSAIAVVSAIAYWLSVRQLRPSNLERARPPAFVWSTNQEANEEYRSGNVLLHSGPTLQAIEHFQRAIAKDAFFAEAYARLAYAWISFPGTNSINQARTAAEKAISLDPKSSAGHAFLASVKIHELDWAGAEKERTLALRLNPNSEEILLESALNLAVMGRTNEAVAVLEKALMASPVSTSNLRVSYSGLVYLLSRQYDRVIETYDRFPNCRNWMRNDCAQAYLEKGDFTNALRLGRMAALEQGEDANRVNQEFDALERALNEGGPKKYWERRLEFEGPKNSKAHLMRMAAIQARLGQTNDAFNYLSLAKEKTPPDFASGIKTDPSFDSLRTDQRFRDMIDELWRKK